MLQPQVFKANDIRGVVGAEWDAQGAAALGAAFVSAFGLAGKEFVLGRDMRTSGVGLSAAFAQSAIRSGASPVDISLASTDEVWYASGALGLPGVQFTASHNPCDYNGVKFCLPGAAPITPELMAAIREQALNGRPLPDAPTPGRMTSRDILPDYAAYLHRLVDCSDVHGLKIVVDAGNGMAGHTTAAVLGPLDVEVIGLYLDLDGSFPNHPPNPLDPANLVDARRAVVEHGADIGLVFDGDADRCFIIDEHGEVVNPSAITALVARDVLAREPGAAIVVNSITSKAVADVVAAAGGRLVVSPVGHTHIKAHMAAEHAVFGGEHSAHYYFREFWGADTGMVAALTVLAMVGRTGLSVSQLVADLPSYSSSGEINTHVSDPKAVMKDVADTFCYGGGDGSNGLVGRESSSWSQGPFEPSPDINSGTVRLAHETDATVEENKARGTVPTPTSPPKITWSDGLRIDGPGWWVSVRESNTEPLLRLNVEAADEPTMAALRDRALAIIRKEPA